MIEWVLFCLGGFIVWKFLHPKEMKIGHGWDIHRLKPGNGNKNLILGGVEISRNFQVEAHSDGDVILHALTDAILGAAGFPDIGQLFPDNNPLWANSPSSTFLLHALDLVKARGWRVVSADVTLVLEKPKLGTRMLEISRNLSQWIDCNVKAKTSEGLDAVGRGEAISAFAVVLIEK